MVLLGRINARVWLTLSNSNTGGASADHPKDDLDFLHYRVDRWYDELPESLKLPREIGSPESQIASRSLYRLRLLLYLRARQTKILLYQRVLHTPALFHSNTSQGESMKCHATKGPKPLTPVTSPNSGRDRERHHPKA